MSEVKAVVFTGRNTIELRTLPKPEIHSGDMLIKVAMCGICASDLHILAGDFGEPYPLIPGHEFVGTVAEIGSDAKCKHGVAVGDKVSVEMLIPCGQCECCLKGLYNLCQEDREKGIQYGCNISLDRESHIYGGWSEYLYVPMNALVHRLPDHAPWERTVLTEPLAVAVHAVNLTPPRRGDHVAVVGAGPIGLLTVVAAKAAGAESIILIGSRSERLELGKRLGASDVIDYRNERVKEKLLDLTNGRGADIVFETAGTTSSQKESLEYASYGGTVNYMGLTGGKSINLNIDFEITFKELKIQSSFLSSKAYERAIEIIGSGEFPMERMITHQFSLDEVHKALEYSSKRIDNAIKVVLKP